MTSQKISPIFSAKSISKVLLTTMMPPKGACRSVSKALSMHPLNYPHRTRMGWCASELLRLVSRILQSGRRRKRYPECCCSSVPFLGVVRNDREILRTMRLLMGVFPISQWQCFFRRYFNIFGNPDIASKSGSKPCCSFR